MAEYQALLFSPGYWMHKHTREQILQFVQVSSAVLLCTAPVLASGDDSASSTQSSSPGLGAAAALLSPASLQASGARIGSITIVNDNIFDNDDPDEDGGVHRLANALHIRTRPDVIRAQLLFQPGDAYNEQRVEESERLLRSNRYLSEAKITPTSLDNGSVDLEVRTTDVWTLSPSISFGRGGGKNSGGIALKEHNLFGSGASLVLGYKSDVDRDSLSLRYFDRNLLSSRYQLTAGYADASDGYAQNFSLEKPFFALDSRRAIGAQFHSGRRTESLYDQGEIGAQYELAAAKHEFYVGWSDGLHQGWSKRLTTGIGFDSSDYNPVGDNLHPTPALPADRQFIYPFVGFELLQDDYVTTRNFDQMNRTEDRHLGVRASFKVGYADSALGSSEDAWIFSGAFSNTLFRTKQSTIVIGAEISGRLEAGSMANSLASVSARYDKRQSEKRLLHIQSTTTFGKNLDLENTMYLGGDTGLRGYPLRYQAGDSATLFTVEQRVFTDWYPWKIFNVGGAVFFDAGRTWGNDPLQGTNHGWLRDVGFGLRIGSSRSGLGRMLHIDLAYPLDGGADISNVQLVIESRTGF